MLSFVVHAGMKALLRTHACIMQLRSWFFLQPSSPILRPRLRNEVKTLRQKYSGTQRGDVAYSRLISFSPDCLSRGSISPLVLPASPHSFGVDQSFSVDGQHINCDGSSRSASVNKLNHKLFIHLKKLFFYNKSKYSSNQQN